MLVDTTPRSPVTQAMQLVVIIAAMMWLIEALDALFLDGRLDQQGIEPRTFSGLDGVLWAPLLHGGFGHLVSNTLPFVVLGAFVALGGVRRWLVVTATVVVLGGLATWLFARPAIHLGASGLIFGYAGFLLVAGFVEKSLKGVAVAVIVGVMFGGMVLQGIVPVSSHVSWESHLFGLGAGLLAAFALADPGDGKMQSP